MDAAARVRAAESLHIGQLILDPEECRALSPDCVVVLLQDLQLRIVAQVVEPEAGAALDETVTLSRLEHTVDEARSRTLGFRGQRQIAPSAQVENC